MLNIFFRINCIRQNSKHKSCISNEDAGVNKLTNKVTNVPHFVIF